MTIEHRTLFDFTGNLRPIGEHLRRLRESEGDDDALDVIARQCKKDAAWLLDVEAGKIDLTLRELSVLARVLGALVQIGFRPVDLINDESEIPDRFASEREEADWYFTHEYSDELLARRMAQPIPDEVVRHFPQLKRANPSQSL